MIPVIIRLLTGVQARWVGLEPIQPDGSLPQRIYFANHRSNLDAPVIWASLPDELRRAARPVAAQDYWERGPIRRMLSLRVFHCVLIERQHVTHHHNPLQPMSAALESGSSLILFPEGTRGTDDGDGIAEFKSGLWHLAKDFPNVQLVPVYLENLNRILPKGDFLLVPLLASVRFGAPIGIQSGEAKGEFLKRARAAVESLQHEAETA